MKKIGGIFAFKVKDGPGGKEATWVVDVKNGKGSVLPNSGQYHRGFTQAAARAQGFQTADQSLQSSHKGLHQRRQILAKNCSILGKRKVLTVPSKTGDSTQEILTSLRVGFRNMWLGFLALSLQSDFGLVIQPL